VTTSKDKLSKYEQRFAADVQTLKAYIVKQYTMLFCQLRRTTVMIRKGQIKIEFMKKKHE